jgi:hypothetical protein
MSEDNSAAVREAKLAQALRANLRRRKSPGPAAEAREPPAPQSGSRGESGGG